VVEVVEDKLVLEVGIVFVAMELVVKVEVERLVVDEGRG